MGQLGFHIPSLIVYLANFVILLILLYFVGYKPLLRMMDQRSSRIRESLEEAERVRREGQERQVKMEQELAQARQEGQQFIQQAREVAERYREEETVKARQEAQALIERARAEIQQERNNAAEQVRRDFADLAILAAEKVIHRSLNKAIHQDLIKQVIEESSGLHNDN